MVSTLFQYMYSLPLLFVHISLSAMVQVWHSRHLFRSKTIWSCLPSNSDIIYPSFPFYPSVPLTLPSPIIERELFRNPLSPCGERARVRGFRSEEHTSELQSQSNLVCRL